MIVLGFDVKSPYSSRGSHFALRDHRSPFEVFSLPANSLLEGISGGSLLVKGRRMSFQRVLIMSSTPRIQLFTVVYLEGWDTHHQVLASSGVWSDDD